MTRYTVHFSGNVQGVGFRYTVVNAARNYTAAGYVQNLPDGRVKLLAEGEPKELDALIDEVMREMGGHIRSHTFDKSNATGEFGQPAPGGIRVRY
jgi:acylphosphatase